jgi:hypothetical protein
MEFYADASSLLIAIYEILVVIFSYVNLFYGHNDVSKKMFFFKEVENSENFNVTKKTNILNDLISITDLRHILSNLNEFMSEDEIDDMLFEADSDYDGFINYKDFLKNLMSNNS